MSRASTASWLSSLLPGPLRRLDVEIADRLAKAPLPLNDYGFDPFGFHAPSARRLLLPAALLYRYWFRVETHDIRCVPEGGALLIANHSGQFGYDGAMLGMAMLLDADPPRLARGMAEHLFVRTPWAGTLLARLGSMVGTPENCTSMLEAGECVMVFPEGARGANKPFRHRYQLQRFGTGFVRLALETGSPVVPVGIVGSEEQQPGLWNLRRLGGVLGMPAFPITPTFPWLGPLGLLPLPVRYRIHFGEPMLFQGDSADEDAVIEEKVDQVRAAIAGLLEHGRAERSGIFS